MHQSNLLVALKVLLDEKRFSSQLQLAKALSIRGFNNISQTQVSRLINKIGAIKVRNNKNQVIYRLPEHDFIPQMHQDIDTVILSIQHNENQIIIKTVAGGAGVISKIIENIGESIGILGCISSNNTILIIPENLRIINETIRSIITILDLENSV
ncbi:MAG: ArgR family transcriptional regulator [Colwellia sp.]|nr:ArgR family transcriptional regulator [Colwellia sp.]